MKSKKMLITPSRSMEMKSLANLTGIPEQVVADAYLKSFVSGMRPFDILQSVLAIHEADKNGWDYTPIFWHRTDDGVLHLTMWDMDEQPKPRERVRHAWAAAPRIVV